MKNGPISPWRSRFDRRQLVDACRARVERRASGAAIVSSIARFEDGLGCRGRVGKCEFANLSANQNASAHEPGRAISHRLDQALVGGA